MQIQVLPLFLFAVCGVVLAASMVLAARLLGPHRAGAVKEMPYESGMDPVHDARRRFDVRFYLVAIAFLVFDVELLFLYPWAVASRNAHGIDAMVARAQLQQVGFDRGLVFGEIMAFLLLVVLALVYVWRKGVLRWR